MNDINIVDNTKYPNLEATIDKTYKDKDNKHNFIIDYKST